jgi:YesN/AraC family two-component response regulator
MRTNVWKRSREIERLRVLADWYRGWALVGGSEDERLSRFAAQGFRVLTAESGVQAMRIIAQEPVDLLFTDIVMPGQDGIELAREAKKLRPDLRVLFSTGYFSRAQQAIGLGELLFKPMHAAEIEKAVEKALCRLG